MSNMDNMVTFIQSLKTTSSPGVVSVNRLSLKNGLTLSVSCQYLFADESAWPSLVMGREPVRHYLNS